MLMIYLSYRTHNSTPATKTTAVRKSFHAFNSHSLPSNSSRLLEHNSSLNGRLVLHRIQTLLPLLNLELLVHDTLNPNLTRIQVVDSSRETVCLGERSQNGNLITKDLGRGPRDAGSVGVDTVYDELTTTADVVDGGLENGRGSGGFDDDVESVGVVFLDLVPLGGSVVAGEGDVDISSIELFRELHLVSGGGGKNDVTSSILLQELGKNETGGSSADHEDGGTEFGRDLLQPVCGARSGLEEGSVDVREVLDLEHFLLRVSAVFRECSVHGDAVCLEILTKQRLASTAVETALAQLGVIGDDTVSDGELGDLGADGGDGADTFVAGDEGELCEEFAFVDVEVGSADTAGGNLDEDVGGAEFGERQLDNSKRLGLVVLESLHGLGKLRSGHFDCVLWSGLLGRKREGTGDVVFMVDGRACDVRGFTFRYRCGTRSGSLDHPLAKEAPCCDVTSDNPNPPLPPVVQDGLNALLIPGTLPCNDRPHNRRGPPFFAVSCTCMHSRNAGLTHPHPERFPTNP
ncbi:hypothetical protein G7K_5237-t1 [Saitoella complicata NRRL Y-17804]|uniref:Uncharacterized protein n=1 Tax=Saitoella complicata (strain BCRC 22490 / CBS 7301 / JCM 7358 / NBRC 10748 / NRRL Y-17804) TaxID=698492 RepID=A0A0E9NN66_SAICN|nr:hypothetical protein G7K_5237-t1 [Saitoella complicata NRRL Y-17804]